MRDATDRRERLGARGCAAGRHRHPLVPPEDAHRPVEVGDLGESLFERAQVGVHRRGLYRCGVGSAPDDDVADPTATRFGRQSCATRCRSAFPTRSCTPSSTAGASSRSRRWRRSRVEALGTDLEVRPIEEFGADEIRRSGLDIARDAERARSPDRTWSRHRAGDGAARFPLGIADALRVEGRRACGRPEALRRPPPAQERPRARRDPASAEGGRGGHRDGARAPEPRGAGGTVGSRSTASRLRASS